MSDTTSNEDITNAINAAIEEAGAQHEQTNEDVAEVIELVVEAAAPSPSAEL